VPVGEAVLSAGWCGVGMGLSSIAAGSCTSSITVTGTRHN